MTKLKPYALLGGVEARIFQLTLSPLWINILIVKSSLTCSYYWIFMGESDG